ncbi:MAG: nucleotide-diphospho-sugar transferase [Flavobacterium sp.]|nr:nucleotide-diphospho-sugar transferase [Flavobacterium sp.]
MFKTPVLIIIFNRPDTTKLLIEVLRNIKPKYLFVSADGPRLGNIEDVSQCNLTREVIKNEVDWDCEIKTLFHESNKGCRVAPPTAISWFFKHVEKGIIMEDDCLTDLSFFNFAEELLNKYEFDDKIMHISASSPYKKTTKRTFSFCNYPLIWGWATWRRAWEKYDISISDWQIKKEKKDLSLYQKNKKIVSFFENKFDAVFNYSPNDLSTSDSNTWDYQWCYCLLKHNGLAILPKDNLVKNIGFGENATHTTHVNDKNANRETFKVEFPIVYPRNRSTRKANYEIEYEFLNRKRRISLYKRFVNKLKKMI